MQKEGSGVLAARRGEAALEDALFTIFELILVVVVGAALGLMVKGLANDPAVEQQYLAAELSLLLDTAQAAPGNVVFGYQAPKLHLSATVERGDAAKGEAHQLMVAPADLEPKVGGPYPIGRYFHPDRFLTEWYGRVNTERHIRISKAAGELRLEQQPLVERTAALAGPSVDTEKTGQRSVAVWGENAELQQMLTHVVEGAPDAANADLQILTIAGQELQITIPDNLQSKKLTSLILRELPFELSAGSIIPISERYLAADDPRQRLRGNIGVLLEVPPAADLQQIGIALNKAVQQYFQPSFTIELPAEQPSEVIGDARVIAVP